MAASPATPGTFPGYPAKGITWLRQIAKHNERDWFLAHQAVFETAVKEPTEALVAALNRRLMKFAPDYVAGCHVAGCHVAGCHVAGCHVAGCHVAGCHAADVAGGFSADPGADRRQNALTRIYRDVRFSKDKSPYHTSLGARFTHLGRAKEVCAGFWLQISAKGLEIVGGTYLAGAPALAKIRARLAEEHVPFEQLCRRKALRTAMGELQGERLKRVPRGFAAEHPAADLLRRKQLYFRTVLPVSVARSPDVVKEVARRLKLMTPLVTWLDEALA